MRVLVADDHAPNRRLLHQFFTALGHEVIEACDGEDGWRLVRSVPVDVVVSDALMPRMDGFQFCRNLKAHPELFRVPFLFYTATYTDPADEQFARRIGANDFLLKPSELSELVKRIERSLLPEQRTQAPARDETDTGVEVLEEYTRRLSIRLEAKVAELERANAALRESDQAVRRLNDNLSATVKALERQVAERLTAEASLRKRTEMLRNAQAVGRIGSWERRPGSQTAECSREVCRIFGLPAQEGEVPIATLLDRVHPDDRSRVATLYFSDGDTRDEAEEEHRILLSDGEARQVVVRRAVFRDTAGGGATHLGIVQDVTERKEAEQQRARLESQLLQSQKMEAIGTLAGGIAHDFNNVLTAILANAEMITLELPRYRVSPQLHESAGTIMTAAGRARELVKQILTFSRRQSVERTLLAPGPVVRDALKLVRSTLAPGLTLEVHLSDTPQVLANEAQLHQVILNLCTNAAHAVDARSGVITVSLDALEVGPGKPPGGTPALGEGRYIRLAVRDNGCGMASPTLARIFEPFFTTKPTGEGTGLGLAVVHGIVHAHQGVIVAESTPGQGTLFTVYLPAAKAAPQADVCAPSNQARGGGQKILFVDDEPSVAKIACRLLMQLGYTAVSMTDAVAAKERVMKAPAEFDLVITDYLMPRLTGVDLAAAIRTVRPDLPMILAAGFGGQLDGEGVKAHGFCDFISKPFTLKSLADAVSRALAERTAVAPSP